MRPKRLLRGTDRSELFIALSISPALLVQHERIDCKDADAGELAEPVPSYEMHLSGRYLAMRTPPLP